MHQHLVTRHEGAWDERNLGVDTWKHFKVEVVKTHRTSFIRQIHEAVTIMLEPGTILNSQEEYNRCLVPSLEVKGEKKMSKHTQQAREQRQQERIK